MKYAIATLTAAGLIASFILYSLIVAPLPVRSGERIELLNLGSNAKVFFNERGIPVIQADSEEDAYRVLGYVQASNRLFQMDLSRRLGCGRLAELFGERAIPVDSYFRTLGIRNFAVKKVAEPKFLKTDSYLFSKAYVEGINAYIANGGTSLDYWIADVEPAEFSVEDLICVNGNLAHNFAKALSDDVLTSHIWSVLGPDYAEGLVYTSNPMHANGTTEKGRIQVPGNVHDGFTKLASLVKDFRTSYPVGWLEGSNSWVMSAERAQQSHPVLVNDPHIGFGMPSVWFEAAIITPTFRKHGFFLSGVPFAVLGHDENLAWGLTMLQNDDMDFFVETCADPECQTYRTPDGTQQFSNRVETIKVKDGKTVELKVRLSRHGPIMNGVLDELAETRPVAMRWSFTDEINEGFETFLKVNRATNFQEFEDAVSSHHSPGLNFSAVDSQGTVGMIAGGALVKRAPGVDGHQLQDGASGRGDWIGYRPFSDNPRIVNPAEGYAYSANHGWRFAKEVDADQAWLQGYFSPDDRWMRLAERLQADGAWDRERHTDVQLDVTKPLDRKLLAAFLEIPGAQEVLSAELSDGAGLWEELERWDGSYEIDLVAPTVAEAWTRELARAIFEDELGPERFAVLVDMHSFEDTLRRVVADPASPWWRQAGSNQTRGELVRASMTRALRTLKQTLGERSQEWRWGRVHSLTHRHPFGKRSKFLDSLLSVGPFEVPGGRETLNNFAMKLLDREGKVTYGPSTRRVLYVGQGAVSSTSNPVGQSLHFVDHHRDDQAEGFVRGDYSIVQTLGMRWDSLSEDDVLTFEPARR